MSDIGHAPGGEVAAPVAQPVATPAVENTPLSPSEAGRALASRRSELRKQRQDQPAGQERAPEAAALDLPQELASQEASADPQLEAPGETREAEPAAQPAIEPPRSWTKEAKERFNSLPRDTQEYVAAREQEREREIRRSQNDAADSQKALTAEREAVAQARQKYEAALPALLQTLYDQQSGEFADIRTMADVERLAREDWPRYALWDAQQKKIGAVRQEAEAAQQRQTQEYGQKWHEFAKRQDELLAERVPDLADKTKAAKLQESAIGALRDHGFTDQELGQLWNGQASISLRDYRMQLLILDGVKFREAQERAKQAASAKPLPPVAQRPGVAQPRGAGNDAQIQALQQKLDQSGSLKDAAALRAARRAASR